MNIIVELVKISTTSVFSSFLITVGESCGMHRFSLVCFKLCLNALELYLQICILFTRFFFKSLCCNVCSLFVALIPFHTAEPAVNQRKCRVTHHSSLLWNSAFHYLLKFTFFLSNNHNPNWLRWLRNFIKLLLKKLEMKLISNACKSPHEVQVAEPEKE